MSTPSDSITQFLKELNTATGKNPSRSKTCVTVVCQATEMKVNAETLCTLRSELRLPVYIDVFSSESLFVRPIFPLDYRALKTCFGDEKNMRYVGPGRCIKGRALKEQFMRLATRNLNKSYTSGWSIITHEGIAGIFTGYKNALSTEVEIAYALSPQFAQRKLTTNAGKLILQYRYEYPDFTGKIIATVHPNNNASQCVLEKLGLKSDPERQNVPKFGSVRNYYQLEVAPPILYSFKKKPKPLEVLSEQGDKNVNGMSNIRI